MSRDLTCSIEILSAGLVKILDFFFHSVLNWLVLIVRHIDPG